MFGKIISKISGEIPGNISDNIPTIKKVDDRVRISFEVGNKVMQTADNNFSPSTHNPTVIINTAIDEVEQYAQKCAWCGRHLIGAPDAQFAKYNGPDKRYRHWICHEECNIPILRLDTGTPKKSDSHTPKKSDTSQIQTHLDEILFTRNRSHVLMYTIPEEPHRLISSDSRTQSPDIQP